MAQSGPGAEQVLQRMRERGWPITRESYIAYVYPDGPPAEWTAEDEMMMPKELQHGYEPDEDDAA